MLSLVSPSVGFGGRVGESPGVFFFILFFWWESGRSIKFRVSWEGIQPGGPPKNDIGVIFYIIVIKYNSPFMSFQFYGCCKLRHV